MVVKSYHERGLMAIRRKKIASWQAASNVLHSAGLTNEMVDLPTGPNINPNNHANNRLRLESFDDEEDSL